MTVVNPQTVILSVLKTSPDLNAIINGRIYDMTIPAGSTMPCVTMQQVSETIDPITFVRRTTVQIDCYSEVHTQADEIAELVLAELTNHSHVAPQGTTVFNIKPDSLRDLSDPATRLFRVTGDYAVIWRK